eukprot:gnl/Hemi2/14467_TR4909_c0_g1_i1.p1 gnl/Hemi2/14467_TR4909_c0_g1~~gnl/Hemi2/14467_TR4909_c0_g1_i1.p1  ORF type:complete len:348 (-),score=84.17 gnl/Hemi2/14467_TR4909_c0_g1_i1:192-1235(-)
MLRTVSCGARSFCTQAYSAPGMSLNCGPTPQQLSEQLARNAGFRYTVAPTAENILSPQQRADYEEKGFIVIKKLYPLEAIEKYRSRFVAIANGEVERAPGMLVMRDVAIAKLKGNGEQAITKLQDWQNDAVLFEYCQDPHILRVVRGIIGPNFRSVHTMLINKPPDVGVGSSRHPPHQDLWYFPFRPADQIVAAWTAMQTINQENGCLCVEPGTHRRDLLYKHEYPSDGIVNKAYHGIQGMSSEASAMNMLHVDMDPGDTIFFHPLLIHGSGRNNSQGYRKAISCHFASSNCHFVDVKGTIQEPLATEIEGMAARKGLNVAFNDLWRLKSRLVSGVDGSFIDMESKL